MHFIFQIILLAVGFSIGYGLLIKANKQEGALNTVGKFLGWILILMTLFASLLCSYYSIKILKNGPIRHGYPMHNMMQEQKMQMMNQERSEEIKNNQKSNEEQEDLQENEDELQEHKAID